MIVKTTVMIVISKQFFFSQSVIRLSQDARQLLGNLFILRATFKYCEQFLDRRFTKFDRVFFEGHTCVCNFSEDKRSLPKISEQVPNMFQLSTANMTSSVYSQLFSVRDVIQQILALKMHVI